MDLADAIVIVIEDTHNEDPDRDVSNEEIIEEVRDQISAEDVREFTDDDGNRPLALILGYALVICASDDEIAQALP